MFFLRVYKTLWETKIHSHIHKREKRKEIGPNFHFTDEETDPEKEMP